MDISQFVQILWLFPVLYLFDSTSVAAGDETDTDFDWDVDFDSFLESIDSMADMVTDYVGDETGCHYRCKNGATPKKNKKHKPRTNGCGSFGLELDTSAIPAVTKCCDQHDYCYDTCNSDKVKCDDDFKDCLNLVCDKLGGIASEDLTGGCRSTADLMYASTLTLGCKPYKDSQKDACVCQHDEL
ncbi:group XIIA secretory phospholipase A2-like [Haliotis rufescens]|uniref:group XIIA secretory phospholipase A2-like n=1 Tax=Haliotis rufescens TaxID=6454 RepID=UPI00201F0E8F|nr:group XIIA secretory phospholipase A2-like [Haliotis rufescens]